MNDEPRAFRNIQNRARCIVVATLSLIIGCDRGSDAPPPVNAPKTPSTNATSQPTMPAADAPLESMLTVDGSTILFPPARLRLIERPGGVSALLMTIKSNPSPGATTFPTTSAATTDPAEDRVDDTENGLYLDMALNIPDIDQLSEAQYRFTEDQEGDDSSNGIYLAAEAIVVQPKDVSISFEVRPDGLVDVKIEGQLIRPAKTEGGAATSIVNVTGVVRAVIEKPSL